MSALVYNGSGKGDNEELNETYDERGAKNNKIAN